MKLMLAPDGIMVWDTKLKPSGENIYLNATELEELIRWLDANRHGFVEDALTRL